MATGWLVNSTGFEAFRGAFADAPASASSTSGERRAARLVGAGGRGMVLKTLYMKFQK
ncbi:hypothetical protein [Polaromonas sp. CG9_12]|nr:hypothetical protein [Polaromonas sp. CG9_12]